MPEPREIRSPVEFFGPDASEAMGVTTDFRPNPVPANTEVSHVFDGDGREQAVVPDPDADPEPDAEPAPEPDADEPTNTANRKTPKGRQYRE